MAIGVANRRVSKQRILVAALAAMALAGGFAVQTNIAADKKAETKVAAAGKADAKNQVPLNLAEGKTATSSSYQNDGLKAEFAVDGDAGSRWCADGGSVPQWLSVDLGKAEDLTGAKIAFEAAADKYSYKLEGSADGKAWSLLHDAKYLPPDAVDVKFPAKGIRYVKLTIDGTKPGQWASVKELEIFGTQMVAANAAKKKPAKGAGAPATASAVKAPVGWDVSLFAGPPDVNYCTTISASPDGYVYVGIDEQGSLGREKGRGRVVRMKDTKNAGVADQLVTCAKMDNPRGVWADGNTLIVLHPPFLTKYTLGPDGVATGSEELVTGITVAESLNSRGADHTTNGFRVGVDGWIYVAMGDFGATKAVGKDGTELQVHGGGVVRVRLDGSGLEKYSFGQRNIYDVAIDPFMRVFTRDNTNDGGGWNDRLSYVIPSGNYGYPRLFIRFPGEFVDCLTDYGGGSPCGSLWVDEPNLPAISTGLLTVEWGASKVFHHPLVPKGAGFETPVKQEAFLETSRPTDIDYDGNGHFYLASWAGGGFSYSGPNVGFVARVTPKDFKGSAMPDVAKATDADLITHLGSASMKLREAAQREIIRRGDKPAVAEGLEKLAAGGSVLAGRASAIFTLKTLRGDKANETLAKLTKLDDVREVALRALADKKGDSTAPIQPFLDGLKDKDPHVRLIAAWGAGRLGKPEAISGLIPLAGDADFLVQHTTVNALVSLKAVDALLAAIDPGNPTVTVGALRAIQQIHDVKAVDGLAAKLPSLTDPATRSGVYRALCRLHSVEAEWTGAWWGTRPDTSGPYYKMADWAGTAKVRAILENAIKTEKADVLRQLVVDMQKHKIESPAVSAFVASAAKTDPEFRAMLIDQLAQAGGSLTAEQLGLLKSVAMDDKVESATRVKAIRALSKNPKDQPALDATVEALAAIAAVEKPSADLASLLDETIHDAKFAGQIPYFTKIAETGETPAKREVGYSVLVSLATSKLSKADAKAKATKAIDAGWEKPKTAASLLRAVGRTKSTEYREMVEAMATDKDLEVVKAAAYASGRLGLKNTGPAVETREPIEKVGYEKTVQFVLKDKGEPALGKELFTKLGCVGCHTVSADEPPKGPFLGGISTRYKRDELCESIVKPSAKIAQGFDTQWFRLKGNEDEVIEGFVTREGGDDLDLRNAAGVVITIKKPEIAKRGKRDTSVMPEGLVAKSSPQDLANLVAYLETLKAK